MIEENSFIDYNVSRHSRSSLFCAHTALRRVRRAFLFCSSFVFACVAVCGIFVLVQTPLRLVDENSRLRAENEINRQRLYSLVTRIESIERTSHRLAEMSGVDASIMNDERDAHNAGGSYVRVSDGTLSVAAQEQADALLEELEAYAQIIERERLRLPSIWPVTGMLTDRFGVRRDPFGSVTAEMHTGQDISAAIGTPVFAAGSGTVAFAGAQNGYGQIVILDHGDGLTTRYAHLSAITVAVGDTLARGSVIGRVGSTGRSSGPHLHYEVRVGDEPVNPLHYLPRTGAN